MKAGECGGPVPTSAPVRDIAGRVRPFPLTITAHRTVPVVPPRTSPREGSWAPPFGQATKLLPAGESWDAVRVPAYLGDRVLARLGREGGAVVRDPYAHRLYWFIAPGAADAWIAGIPDVSFVQVLGTGCWVMVPPLDRRRSAGPYWQVPVADGCRLTDAELLRVVLDAVLAEALGPRAEAAR